MPTFNNFVYTERKEEIIIRSYVGDAREIVVPSFVKGKPVTEITSNAFVATDDFKSWDKYGHCINRIHSIQLPDTIRRLEGAFRECVELESISLPDNAELIGGNNFALCFALKSIEVSDNNQYYQSRNGILYSKDGKKLLCCPANHPFENDEYLNGVEEIGKDAFRYCKNLVSIDIPEKILKIYGGAFSCCHNLEKVNLHPNLAMVESGHFWWCESLKEVVYYNTENIVPENEFYNCINLEKMEIPNKVRIIKESAFSGTKLREFVVPKGVATINRHAFLNCYELRKITIPRSVSRINKDAFLNCGRNLYSEEQKKSVATSFGMKAATEFVVIPDSKSEQFCKENGYKITYV